MSGRACAWLVLALGAAFAAPARADLYYLVVGGLGGEPKYQEQFDKATAEIAAVARRTTGNDRVIVLQGESATRAAVVKAFDSLRTRTKPADSVAVVLVGHGSFDGDAYKFNLPGPDIDGDGAEAVARRRAREVAARRGRHERERSGARLGQRQPRA